MSDSVPSKITVTPPTELPKKQETAPPKPKPLIKIALTHTNAKMPTTQNDDAGYDIYAPDALEIPPHSKVLIDACFKVEIPKGYFIRILPRSSLALKKDITTDAGVIDCGYRNTIGVILRNHSDQHRAIGQGDRIAQFVVLECHKFDLVQVEENELSKSVRGQGGFGSTGQ